MIAGMGGQQLRRKGEAVAGMRQLLRFVIVGIASNAVCFAVYCGLAWAGMHPMLAMTLVYLLGVLQGFWGNHRWTFARSGPASPALLRYGLAYALGYAVNLAGLWVFAREMSYRHEYVQAAMLVVVALMLFLLQKFWVFCAPRVATTTEISSS